MNFDIEKTVSYWQEGADYDFGTAEDMFKSGRYPYALFMGHLALEKLLKALVVKETKQHAERTHSLPRLARKTGVEIPEDILKKLDSFMQFYREGRYPEEEMKFYKQCTKKYTQNNLGEIKRIFGWLKEKL